MFTGLIEEIGRVEEVRELSGGRAFRISAQMILEDAAIGASIAVDGACHTVTAIHRDSFEVQSVATTLQRTTMAMLAAGSRVNLERALALGSRVGGHLVQGHVDGVGEVLSILPRDEHVLIDVSVPTEVGEVTILHGSITLNGISLTVNALPGRDVVQVSIIPHTWAVTTLSDLATGSKVNIEGDLMGKYVRQMLAARLEA